MAASLDGVLQAELREKILNSHILVVGSGGIGCEILKNLVLTGFPNIEIIDLDTIDLSNLNRQFLFHREHVGKSKAQVAVDSALKFNPDANIKAYHDSITSTDYGVNFYKKFDVVLNALDNKAARNHVNRMCLNADIPLIESGTAGYNGQVELIKKGMTQCYECTPKATQKTFPGCTIRNTPSEPIHCIVWAKHLFNQLFGETADEEDISPDMADPEAKNNEAINNNNTDETSAAVPVPAAVPLPAAVPVPAAAVEGAGDGKKVDGGNVERVSTRQWAKDCKFEAEALFDKFFYDDINYLLSMSNLWKSRKPPAPVRWQEIVKADVPVVANFERQYHNVWSLNECAIVFGNCLKKLSVRHAALVENDSISWDKDDQDAMDFVAACANIRAYVFEIARKSRFEIKSMAGNIIPAIATTNAITAGIVVLRAFNVLRGQFSKCQSVYVRLRQNPRQQLMVPEKQLTAPNPKCFVCAAEPAIHLRVDTHRLKIVELRDDVLIKAINMVQPEVTISSKGVVIISADAEETEDNEQKVLSALNIVDGVLLRCDDFVQQYELTINIVHFDAAHDEPLFEVIADAEQLKPKEELKEHDNEKAINNDDIDDGPSTSKKRRIENEVVNADDADDDDDLCLIEEESDNNDDGAADENMKQTPENDEITEKKETQTAVIVDIEGKEEGDAKDVAQLVVEPMEDIEEIKDDSDSSLVGSEISSMPDQSAAIADDIVDLDSDSTSSSSSETYNDSPPRNMAMNMSTANKRKAPLVDEEITEILDSDEEQEVAGNGDGCDTDDNDTTGPTPCKRSRVTDNKFYTNEVINID